ncbi:MAG: hypothetical protein ABSF77_02765 [Spirochaetia bacterium]|jgi:hypothetical protein
MKLKPAVRIPLTLTLIVVVTGILAFKRIAIRSGQLPLQYFIAWIIVSVVLIGFSIWSWRRGKRT